MLKPAVKLITALNSNSRPMEIGFGIGAGILLGLMPTGNGLWFILFALFFILRINFPGMLLSAAVVKITAPLFDGPLHSLGHTVLANQFLEPAFSSLYNAPLVPFTHFNSTTVMGSLLAGLILMVPSALFFSLLVRAYRTALLPKIRNSKIVKNIKRIPLISKIIDAASEASSGIGR